MEVTTVNSNVIVKNNWILKPNFHMNYGKKRIEKALRNKQKFSTLGEVTDSVFTGGIFKRIFVDNPDYGFPYISAQHMMNANPLEVAKCISKKYTPKLEEMTLKENQILVSCAGTVGNIKLITKDLTEVVGSQDIIRIDADNSKMPYGYLYAYLSTKTAYNYIQSFIYGSVVPRIEPNTLSLLPVPLLPETKQQQIHQLIVEASALRVEANKLLKEAIELFESQLNESKVKLGFQFGSITAAEIFSKQKRFDSQYQILWKSIKNEYKTINYKKIGELAKSIFVGGRGKRNYVDNGIPFLSSSDMMLFNPVRNSKKVSFNTPGLKSMKVEKFDILISRSGTVGNTIIVGDSLKNVAVSEHALRLKINSQAISPSYVFAFLNTNIGKRAMEASAFGSVIITLNEELIGDIDIPIFEKSIQNNISMKVENYIESIDKATIKENQAIDLIEKEIDAWQ